MKISHAHLEELRGDPQSFTTLPVRRFGGISMYRRWQLVLKTLHADGLRIARDRLRETLESNYNHNRRNTKQFDALLHALEQYSQEFNHLGGVAVEVLRPMKLIVSPKLTIGGEVARLDLNPAGGYSAYLLSKEGLSGWKGELRFPLLQGYIAGQLSAPLSEVSVGVYSLEIGAHKRRVFSAAEVRNAQLEATRIAAALP